MSCLSIATDVLKYWQIKRYCFFHMFLFFFHQVRCILCIDGISKLFLLVKVFHTFLFSFRQLMWLR